MEPEGKLLLCHTSRRQVSLSAEPE